VVSVVYAASTPACDAGGKGSTPFGYPVRHLTIHTDRRRGPGSPKPGGRGSTPRRCAERASVAERRCSCFVNSPMQVRILPLALEYKSHRFRRWTADPCVCIALSPPAKPVAFIRPVSVPVSHATLRTSKKGFDSSTGYLRKFIQPVGVADCTRPCEGRRPGSIPGQAAPANCWFNYIFLKEGIVRTISSLAGLTNNQLRPESPRRS
jgi:hypothetical protein